jgi:hypothetical protein
VNDRSTDPISPFTGIVLIFMRIPTPEGIMGEDSWNYCCGIGLGRVAIALTQHYFIRFHMSVRVTGVPSRSVVLKLIFRVSPESAKRLVMLLPMSPGNMALSR